MLLVEIYRTPQHHFSETEIRAGIRRALSTSRKRFGMIDDVSVSFGKYELTKLDSNMLDFIFSVDRKAQGFALLQKANMSDIEGWHVTEIGLLQPLRWKGIGFRFYHMLLDKGYTLFSGAQQTPDSEKLWKKLMADSSLKIDIVVDDEIVDVATDPWSTAGASIVARKL